jgi:DNA uptake protein ComE-like DNA-binding protein
MNRQGTLQGRLVKQICMLGLAAFAVSAALIWLSGCNTPPKTDQQLQEQAAQTTQQVKQEAQEAAANAKVAAAKAERKVNDIAAGVKEGLHNDKPAPGSPETIDINSATTNELAVLPGISPGRAQRIVANRPYSSPHDLVDKGLISQEEYEQISGRIAAD